MSDDLSPGIPTEEAEPGTTENAICDQCNRPLDDHTLAGTVTKPELICPKDVLTDVEYQTYRFSWDSASDSHSTTVEARDEQHAREKLGASIPAHATCTVYETVSADE